MKAEERKELATNDLASGLEKFVTGMKEGPSKNTVLYVTVAIAGVALVVGMFYTWTYYSRQSKSADSARWEKWNELNAENTWSVNADELEKFANDKDNAGTAQARLARFELARYWIQSDRELAAPDRRTEALANVRKARDLYMKLIDEAHAEPALAQEAMLGAAKGSESLGEVEQAKKYYQKLLKEYPQSVFGKDAAKQLDRLDKDNHDLERLKDLFDKGKR